MRWFRIRPLFAAVFCAISLVVCQAAFALDLTIGPLQVVAGGGLGEGAAALSTGMQPTSVLVTDAGLWVADEQFNRVRLVATDGTIRSIVGSGIYGFNGGSLPALSSHLGIVADLAQDAQGRLLLVDLANRQIRILSEDGRLHTFVDAEHPLFTTVSGRFAPAAVAVGPGGGVHVADRGTNVVWQFDPDGQGRRVAGNGTRGFSGDGAPSALGQLADPRAVAVGDDGAIWIADTGNRRVRVVAPNGRLWTAVSQASVPAVGLKPIDIAVGPDRQVYILDEQSRQVLRLGPAPRFEDGLLVGAGTLTVVHRFSADGSQPVAMDVAADGTIYVADRGRRQVLVLDVDDVDAAKAVAGNGTVRAAGDGTDARNAALYAPAGMAFAADGTLFFADRLNHLIRRVGADGVIRSIADLSLNEPEDIIFDRQGRAFVADTGNDRILRIDTDGRVVVVADPVSAGSSRLSRPTALAFDDEDRLLIADSGHRVVRRLQRDGTLTTIAGNGATSPVGEGGPGTASAILRPVDIKVDSRGVLWIADAGAHCVYRQGADGLLRLVAGTGHAGIASSGSLARQSPLHTPTGIEPDGAGGLIIAESGNGRLVHVDADGVLRIVADDRAGKPSRLATTPAGDIVFSDGLTHRILQLTVRSNVAPVSQRVSIDPGHWQVETLAALPLTNLQQIGTHPRTGALLVTSRSSVTAIDGSGRRTDLLVSEADHFLIGGVAIDDFGQSLLLVTRTGEGQPKPMTLVRFPDGLDDGPDDGLDVGPDVGPGSTPERFDLEFLFGGAGALAIGSSGDVYLHQADDGSGSGRLLRLRHERLLNIPGFPGAVGGRGIEDRGIDLFAKLPADNAVLAAAPDGGVYVALRGSRDIILVRDLNGDGVARGALEQRRIANVPEAPVAVTATSDGTLYAATAANRVYQIDGNSPTLVASGFAPLLIDLIATKDGGLLVLEGDRLGGRLLCLRPARPEMAVWPAALDFGAGPLGRQATSTIVLRNDGPLPIRVTPQTVFQTVFQTEAQLQEQDLEAGGTVRLAAGEARQIEAHWTPSVPGQTTAELLWRDASGQVLLKLPVVIHGQAPRLDAPNEVDMGTVWVGGTGQTDLQLRNSGDVELLVEGLELVDGSGAVLSAGPLVSALGFAARIAPSETATAALAPGEQATISLTLAPPRREVYDATLRVLTNDPLHPRRDILLHGIGGGALLSVTEIDLGTLSVGRRGSQVLTLTNTGDLDLRIDSILSGTRQLSLTPRSLTVAAGETKTVRMDFAPAVHGEVTGALTLLTNDPARPRWMIPFHGLGVSQQLELSALTHDFGAVSGPVRWEVHLSNYHGRRLNLLEVSTNDGAFHVVSAPRYIEAGMTATFVVEFQPRALSESTGQLLLRTDLAEAPEAVVALRGSASTAGQIRFEPVAALMSMWPGEDLRMPLEVVDAAGLRGAVFTVALSAGFTVAGIEFPEAGLLRQAGEPLAVMNPDDDAIRVGLSLTGAGGNINGSGRLAVLRLRALSGVLPSSVTVRLSALVARSAIGTEETLLQPPDVALQLKWKGDVNHDGRLDISDVFLLVDAFGTVLTESEQTDYDLNEDGIVGSADVVLLVEHLPASAKRASMWDAMLPDQPTLLAPFPNPFNAETVLTVALPEPAHVELAVHNLLGQRIRTLRSQVLPAGIHRAIWNGTDSDGHVARSGVYFAVLDVAERRAVQRLLLVR